MYYLLLAALYIAVLGPLSLILVKTLVGVKVAARRAEVLEGIAAACLICVLGAVVLTKGLDLRSGIVLWVGFGIAVGLSIWLKPPLNAQLVLSCAIAPSIVLLGALLAIRFLPEWLDGELGWLPSVPSDRVLDISVPRTLLFLLGVGVMSVLLFYICIQARARLVLFAKQLFRADPKRFSRMEKVINSVVRMGAIVVAAIVATRS